MLSLEWLKTGVVFIVMISVLVAAHEYGHYLFARIFKMGIEEFAIGFGKNPLFTWMRRRTIFPLTPEQQAKMQSEAGEGTVVADSFEQETIYTVRPWPLGGFVKIKGMLPEEDGSEILVPAGFFSKSPFQRFIVLLAGPTFSVIAGVVLLIVVGLVWGEPYVGNTIQDIVIKSPADLANLKPGDTITAVNGAPVKESKDLVFMVRDKAGVPLKIRFLRKSVMNEIIIVPELQKQETPVLGPDGQPTKERRLQAYLGIRFGAAYRAIPFQAVITSSLEKPFKAVAGIFDLFRHREDLKDSVGGPIAIVSATKGATQGGMPSVIELAGLLSISVGIMNLLPIHPLDGGQMVVAFVEMLRRGRRLSLRLQNTFAGFGFAMLLLLIATVMVVDVGRLREKPDPTAPKLKRG
jgi:regulator of sigma E protease